MRFRVNLISALLLAISVTSGGSAWAAGPSVSVPSTADASGKVVVKGADLAAYKNVTVRFMHAKLTPIDAVVQVGADGRFVLPFVPPIDGAYTVVVFDSNGQEIGQGNFGHFR